MLSVQGVINPLLSVRQGILFSVSSMGPEGGLVFRGDSVGVLLFACYVMYLALIFWAFGLTSWYHALQAAGQQGLNSSYPLGNPGSALPNGGARFQGKLGANLDPLSPSDVEKLNAAFITRHQAALLGSHLRA